MSTSAARFVGSPTELAASLVRNRNLIWQLTRRDVVGRYRGSVLGIFWSLFHPLLMLGVYTFIFGVVFKAKWGLAPSESRLDFALVLFAGLIVYGIFSECISRAPGVIVAQPNFVKKIVFPLEVMPVVLLGSALFHALVSLAVLLVAIVLTRGLPPWTALLLPAVILPLCSLCLGLAWFLASMGVYLRDTTQVIGIVTSMLMFLSPLFFPLSALPPQLRIVLAFNPLSLPIELSRQLLLGGQPPDWPSLALYAVVSLAVMWMGFWWFQRTRRGFADVI